MADEPSLPDFQAAAVEVTSALPEPTRPEGDYSRTAGPDGPDLRSINRWGNDFHELAQQHLQQRQPDVQQSEEKQQALIEAAQALAPKENSSPDQQPQQQQERDGR